MCVIRSKPGPDRDAVSNDGYERAPLVGWQCGYDVAHLDAGAVAVDELDDYACTLGPLRFVASPSDDFGAGLGTAVGREAADRLSIRFGDGKDCGQVPR